MTSSAGSATRAGPGVYLRVLQPGAVTAGDVVELEPAPAGALPLLELQDLFYGREATR